MRLHREGKEVSFFAGEQNKEVSAVGPKRENFLLFCALCARTPFFVLKQKRSLFLPLCNLIFLCVSVVHLHMAQ